MTNTIIIIPITAKNIVFVTDGYNFHKIQFNKLSETIKYIGSLCQIQNLNTKDVSIINIAGITDINPRYDNKTKSTFNTLNIMLIR